MVFRRYFFLWFSFFAFCFGLSLLASLYPLWNASQKYLKSEENNIASALHAEFAVLAPSSPLVEEWDWNRIFNRFQKDFPSLKGMALVDNVDGQSAFNSGEFPNGWEPILEQTHDQSPHWVDSSSQARLWTILPGGNRRPRYRLWVNLGTPPNFMEFLHAQRFVILGELVFLFALFLLFYWRWGNPNRFLNPLSAATQNSIEHAETLLPVTNLNLPGEFTPLAKSVSLLLEARHEDYQDRKRLNDQLSHSLRQKTQYSQMVQNIREYRENEISAVEAMQNTLLRVNREPVLVLDKTRRILSMNEAAKRVLSISGQTGYPLRHPELEEAIKTLLESDRPNLTRSISLRDPYLGKTNVWKVSLSIQHDTQNKEEIDQVVVSLNKEESNPQKGAPSSKDLLYLYSNAWFESWNHAGSLPTLMDEEERKLVEPLVREVLNCEGKRVETEDLLPVFGLAVQGALPGVRQRRMVGGSTHLWDLFEKWFSYVIRRMTSEKPTLKLAHSGGTRLRIEWTCETNIPFEDWFGQKRDNTL
ncbi:MAG: hypothetical protein KC994_18820, partial [Candidatus Omnitrophica bacterium]|nr:hypothetical protein [Candidatus Omnitrophota bacterium]